jgi:hypothetical protein
MTFLKRDLERLKSTQANSKSPSPGIQTFGDHFLATPFKYEETHMSFIFPVMPHSKQTVLQAQRSQ